MPRPPANVSGELLKRGYVLLGKLARGESSIIYDGQHEATRRRVAIKVTTPEARGSEAMAGRLSTAWNVARGLRHPHLVTTFDGGRLSDGRGFLVMERLRGRDLKFELDEVGRLPVARAVHVMRQVCDALQVLHRRGAVHRDVNPGNIYLSSAGHFADHAKLIDLGRLAVGEDDPMREHAPTGPFHLGTPLYLPPELARGETATPAADFYSLGAVLYHLIAGQPPFFDPEPTRLIAQHVNAPVPGLPDDVKVPPELKRLIWECLEKEPEHRPADAGPILRSLDACLMQVGVAPPTDQFGGSAATVALPPIPPSGVAPEWARFADALRRIVRVLAPRGSKPVPKPVAETLSWVSSARTALEEKIGLADRQRLAADTRARARIARRQGLEQRVMHLEAALESAEADLREAEHAVDAVVRTREKIDEDYRAALRTLEIASGRVGVGVSDLATGMAEVRGLLGRRAEIEAKVGVHREAERGQAESVALLMAERLEVLRAHADVELEEQDEGQRFEWLAARSADDVLSAQRAFENACLNLFLRCVELAAGES